MNESEEKKLKDLVLIDRKEYRVRKREFWTKHGSTFTEISKISQENVLSWGKVIENHAKDYSENIAIKFEDKQITFKEQNELINQYAHYFLSLGLEKGDVAVLLMKNRLEYPIIMSALSKIGVISSLINSDFRGKPLTHSLMIAPTKTFIIDEACFDQFDEVKSQLQLSTDNVLHFSRDKGKMPCPKGYIDLSEKVKGFSIENPTTVSSVNTWDIFSYIFTSGTTGLPKAVPFPHHRVITGGIMFGKIMLDLKPGETHYCCLPLFHSNPIVQGFGAAMYNGATLALARKFKVSNFWDDIRTHQATSFNYIGELCRYLLNQPPRHDDGDNPVTKVTGNGLRPDIWDEFKNRFKIDIVREYYNATELGSGFNNFMNFDKTSGCYIGSRMTKTWEVVEYDIERDELVRDEEGYLKPVSIGVPGLLIFKNSADKNSITFLGYLDKNATEDKLIRNAFKQGDVWVNTGDLIAKQGCTHALFVDRIGDTYRWKGHNISTTEVEGVISNFDDVALSCVFGAKIPKTDGRAGMSAVVPSVKFDDFDIKEFSKHLHDNLALYAVPIFIRFKLDLESTSTFKFKKSTLKKECYDFGLGEENLYIMLPDKSEYTPLTKEIYDNIQKGKYLF